jgi:hypothetical protein
MNFAELVVSAGIEKDALGRSGFARIDMRHYSDISGLCEGTLPGHKIIS